MRSLKQLSLLLAALCCFSTSLLRADITNPCSDAYYTCNPNGSIQVTVLMDYTSATQEWLDCATITLPPGWTYIAGSEVGTGTSADGNYVSDTGNVITFGTPGFCPGGDSDYSTLGAGPNVFTFDATPPAGWNPGDCNIENDGDIIAGISIDYAGDGYGEAGATISGVDGDTVFPTDATDAELPCSGAIIPMAETAVTICPETSFSFQVVPEMGELPCGYEVAIQFDDSAGGTGGVAGGFTLTETGLVTNFDAGLLGVLAANGLDDLGGTWCLTGIITIGDINTGQICEQTEEVCITYLDANDPSCGQDFMCTFDFGGYTTECQTITPDVNCSVTASPQVVSGSTILLELFYETNSGTGAPFEIVSATNGYTTGAEISANTSTGQAGEVVFSGTPGDCDNIPISLFNVSCEPLTYDVYVVPVEYVNGSPVGINPACEVSTITITIYPDQTQPEFLVLETPGDCDNPATATIGFDNGDGLGGGPDGDLDDPEDEICNITNLESEVASQYPCGQGTNTSDIPPLSAADLAAAFGSPDVQCYTDVTFTAQSTCPSLECPQCDAEAPTLALDQVTCPDGATGGPISLGITGGTTNPGEVTEYILSDNTGLISSFATQAEAEAAVAGLAVGEEVCVSVITYVQSELDAITSEANNCTAGLLSAFGVPIVNATFAVIYDVLINLDLGFTTAISVDNLEALVGGMNGGPSLGGGIADFNFIIPGLVCPDAPPFCYRLNTICITGVEDITCATCDDPCANNTGDPAPCTYDPDYDVCDDGCQFTTDTYNNATCECDFVLTTPDCDDNDPATDDSYDAANCVCVNTPIPTCDTETPTLTSNSTTCPDGSMGGPTSLSITGGTTNLGEITEYILSDNTGVITSFVTPTEAELAVAGLNVGEEICITTVTYIQAEFDAIIAHVDACTSNFIEGGLGVPSTGATFQDYVNGQINLGVFIPPTINDFENLVAGMNGGPSQGGGTSAVYIFFEQFLCTNTPPLCYQLNTLCITGVEDITCATCDDPCANNTGDPAPCTYDPDYNVCDDGCQFTTDTYNNATCECDFILTTPDCDDNDPATDDSYDAANCVCVNTVISIAGCTDPCAPNYDANADTGDGTCDPYDTTCNTDCTAGDITTWDAATCSCIVDVATILGCTDPAASNYDATANCDDGLCMYAFTFSLSDPCNCVLGLDLDDDGENEYAAETYTLSNGSAPYTISNTSGTFYDNTGTAYTLATLEAWFNANAPGTGADFEVVVYVVADDVSTHSLEITDSNGAIDSVDGGPCTTCLSIANIPTIGEWGLIILGLLMLIIATVGIREKAASKYTVI